MEPEHLIELSSPLTLTRGETEFDRRTWTAQDIVNPGLALIDRRGHLGVLLAKDMSVEHDGTRMRAVRWVRLPLGWRLGAVRFLSRFIRMRLPDEWLFNEVFLTPASNGMFVARLTPDGLVLPTPSEEPCPTKELSSAQYRILADARGRLLQAQVIAIFREFLGMDGERARLFSAPAWPNGPYPWRIFAGG